MKAGCLLTAIRGISLVAFAYPTEGSRKVRSKGVRKQNMRESIKFPDFNSVLNGIVGQQLSSVTFVMDYWQLSFDGDALTVYSAIAVYGQGRSVSDRDD
jgi:hypothetical protein